MDIENRNLNEIHLSDLEALVTDQVPENIRLEYKRDLYGSNDNSKKELLKDVSAFANSQGGHLIIGVDETNGVASEVTGVICENPDEETLRMEQVIRSGLSPNITGIRIWYVPFTEKRSQEKRYCYLIRIPQSQYPPHRVIINQHNRFYVRNSAGVHEPDNEELRQLFSRSDNLVNCLYAANNPNKKIVTQPLNVYGFWLNLASYMWINQQTQDDLANSCFMLGIALHLLHEIAAALFNSALLNRHVTYSIQIGILLTMLMGFVAWLLGWLVSY